MMLSASPAAVSLLEALQSRSAVLAVVGLGCTGLPLVDLFLGAGFRVIGLDSDRSRIDTLRQGRSYLGHIPSSAIVRLLDSGRFSAFTDPDCLASADAILLCLPTPLTASREPDLSHVRTATLAAARRLRAGQLIVLTSTTYPGTTREVVLPLLAEAGLRAGHDFFLAYSPEREDPGNRQFHGDNIPRLVGGIDPVSAQLAEALFATVTQVVPVSSPEAAEAAKLLENTYRAVNIALVNELKVLYQRAGIDIWEVIEAASTKPFGFQPFYPGPGWGGHCIPIDPFYLAWLGRRLDQPARFVELAGEINTAMTAHVAACIAEALNEQGRAVKGSRILLLGMAYKRDIDDVRESPGLVLLDLLRQKGADLCYNDPHVPVLPLPPGSNSLPLASEPLTEELLREQDCVVIVTDHSVYDWDWIVSRSCLIVDTRNATRQVVQYRERIRKA